MLYKVYINTSKIGKNKNEERGWENTVVGRREANMNIEKRTTIIYVCLQQRLDSRNVFLLRLTSLELHT